MTFPASPESRRKTSRVLGARDGALRFIDLQLEPAGMEGCQPRHHPLTSVFATT
jgi:hypothetical protein